MATQDDTLRHPVCGMHVDPHAPQRVGSETLFVQIVPSVAEARLSPAPIQRLAEVVAGDFVPAVVILERCHNGLCRDLGKPPIHVRSR